MWREVLRRVAVVVLGVGACHLALAAAAAILGAVLGIAAPFAAAAPKTPNVIEAGAAGVTFLMLLYALIGAGDLAWGVLLASIGFGFAVFYSTR